MVQETKFKESLQKVIETLYSDIECYRRKERELEDQLQLLKEYFNSNKNRIDELSSISDMKEKEVD